MMKLLHLTSLITLFVIMACSDSLMKGDDAANPTAVRKPQYARGFDWVQIDGTECLRLFDLQTDSLSILCTICNEEREKTLKLPKNPLFATLSTTHLSYFERMGSLSVVRGTSYAAYVMNEQIKAAIGGGQIASLSGERDLDFERTLACGANIVLTYPYGDQDFNDLKEAGLLVLPISEYLEEHPLGRAEWIRALGFLCGASNQSDQAFKEIEMSYNTLKTEVQLVSSVPSVFTGSNDNGVWFAPPGNSFIGKFIEDAGGSYVFHDRISDENISMDFEVLLEKAMDVDYWGKVVYEDSALTTSRLAEDDERYAALKAFREKKVFYCNTAYKDYFGDGLVEPHIILGDLVAIFHPELMPGHEAEYFELISE